MDLAFELIHAFLHESVLHLVITVILLNKIFFLKGVKIESPSIR